MKTRGAVTLFSSATSNSPDSFRSCDEAIPRGSSSRTRLLMTERRQDQQMSTTQAPTKTETAGAKKKTTRAPKTAKAAKAPPPTKADEIIDALKAASRDKEIDFERLVAALEEAIATAARKVYKVREMAARFDPKSGELTAWTPYRIVEQKTKPELPEGETAPVDPDDVPLGQAVAAA